MDREVLDEWGMIMLVYTEDRNNGILFPGQCGQRTDSIINASITLDFLSLSGMDDIKTEMAYRKDFHWSIQERISRPQVIARLSLYKETVLPRNGARFLGRRTGFRTERDR